jgi:NitT/TauT family transport system substrate-binding protein
MLRWLLLAVALLAAPFPSRAQPLTKVTFGTDWLAEAEHGGFYQAVAMGLYKKRGLDVTIKMGGPQTNGNAAIATGQVDFQLSSGSFAALSMVEQSIPVVAVAAFFQKDPQVMISHPGVGLDTLAQMKGHPIMISAGARSGLWLFLKAKFGYSDDQIRPYNFSMAPFLLDKPVVNLLADNGFDNYSDVILAQSKLVAAKPELVRSFVEASAEGWYHYIYGDPSPGNALIRAANKDMTQEIIDNGIKVMREHGIVDSGDSLTLGIGAMTEARWARFATTMADAGVYPKGLDVKRAYTLDFINKGVGLDLRPK